MMADYREAIEKALIYKDMKRVRLMISQGEDINKRRGFKGLTLLHIAPNLEITKELITLGAKVSVKSKQQETALHYATMFNKDVGVVKELLANGADIIAQDDELRTPLHYAVRNNSDPAVALLLLSKGARTNITDDYDRCPLHYAAMNDRDHRLIKELLICGANVNMTDIQERTPLHYAAINCLEHFGIHEMLRYGADPNARDVKQRTPLHYVMMNNTEHTLAEQLLKFGANVNYFDESGYTPLYLATESDCRNLKVIQMLLEYDANMNFGRDEFWPFFKYCTTLEKAFFRRDIDCAKLLIKITLLRNFDINDKNLVRLDHYHEYPDYKTLFIFDSECFCELSKMIKDRICNKFTLYEFVNMKNEYKKPLYVSSSVVQQISSNYPIYKDIIMYRLEHCMKRARLLQIMERLKISSRSYKIDRNSKTTRIVLNFDCIYKISEYLSNQDLFNCLEASMRYYHAS